MLDQPVSRRALVACAASMSFCSTIDIGRGAQPNEPMTWIKPNALKKGDTIALIAPAGPAEPVQVLSYQQQLERYGFRVQLDQRMLNRRKDYLAGNDDERLQELNQAIRDPIVRGIFPVRGGFGLTRILDRIDYKSLRKDPKIVTGYSDLTALHLAIARKSRVITYHSPMPMSNLVKRDVPEHLYASTSFERMLMADRFPSSMAGEVIVIPTDEPLESVTAGKATGRLLGGNLSLLCATLGTQYSIEAKGTILFLEDVNEATYRVDRLFSQLRLSGVLTCVAGIVIGQFTTKEPTERTQIEQVVREYLKPLGCPAIYNFPVGHVANNVTLPHGAMVELDADLPSLRLLEEPCHR